MMTNHTETFRVMNLLIIVTMMYIYVQTYQIIHFKCVQFTVGQLYLNKFP